MFRTDDENILFSKHSWFDVAADRKIKLKEEVAGMEGNRLLNTSIDDLCAYLVEKYSVDVPALKLDEIVADQRETQIDVRYERARFIQDKSRPVFVTGTEIEVIVPFHGDQEVFKVQPTTFSLNPPRGRVRNGSLHLVIKGAELSAEQVRKEVDTILEQINQHLTTLRGNAVTLANELPVHAREVIELRRKKLLADQNLVSSLGFKMTERAESLRTFAAPEVQRKVKPALPPASSDPYKPEPTLLDADYEHILKV